MAAMVPSSTPDETMERLMDSHGTALFRLCYVMLKDYALAEDAVQETFVKAYKGLAQFNNVNPYSEKSWLNKIAANTCKDIRRSTWFRFTDRKVAVEDVLQQAGEASNDEPDLMHEILALPIKYRQIVLLYYYENLRYEDIAQVAGISISTVHGRLKRAAQKLRVSLERGYKA